MTTRAIIAFMLTWWFYKLNLMANTEFIGMTIIIIVATVYDMIREDKK